MPTKRNLYERQVRPSNTRRTAPQLNPGVARTYQGPGLAKVGDALQKVGMQMHQVNVARQVTKAMAQYKMRAAEFMAKMQNADPSTVDYDTEYAQFMANQGDLTAGVSRDAGAIINNKITEYGANTFGTLKKLEIRNTSQLAMSEAPDVLDSLVDEAAKDPRKLNQLKSEWNAYVDAIAPALPVGASAVLKREWDDAAERAVVEAEEESIFERINAGDLEGAMAIATSDKNHISEKKEASLVNRIEAENTTLNKISAAQKKAIYEAQAGYLISSVSRPGTHQPLGDSSPEMMEIRDRIYSRVSAGTLDTPLSIMPLEYYDMRDKVNNMGTLTDFDLARGLANGIPLTQVIQLQQESADNVKLRPYKAAAKGIISMLNSQFSALKVKVFKYDFSEKDVIPTILREIEEERQTLFADIKKNLIKGQDPAAVSKAAMAVFEGTKKGVIEFGGTRWLKPKIKEFHRGMTNPKNPYGITTKEYIERYRFRGIINLMESGKHQDMIEAAIYAGWFTESLKRSEETYVNKGPDTTIATSGFIPFADEGKFYAAPIAAGQTEADAILTALDNKSARKFDTVEEVEKFTGKQVR